LHTGNADANQAAATFIFLVVGGSGVEGAFDRDFVVHGCMLADAGNG
jgi:hypothetical protein